MTPRLEELDRAECLRLLRKSALGRLVYTVNALPAVQPVNYVLDEESIVIRTESASKLAIAGRHEIVAFEVDEIDDSTGTGWSVVVTGRARAVTDPDEIERAGKLPLHSWALDGRGRFVRISCELITGRRLTADFRP